MRGNNLLLRLIMLLPVLAGFGNAGAQNKGTDHAEQAHIYRIANCLIYKDAPSYVDYFPDMDTFSKMILETMPDTSAIYRQMRILQNNPALLQAADTRLREEMKDHFDSLILRGEALGIEWRDLTPMRFELDKLRRTRDTSYERLIPDRYVGYVFLWDANTRSSYCVAIKNIMQVRGQWFGGELVNIYEARNKDEYLAAYQKALRKHGTDAIIIPGNDETPTAFGQQQQPPPKQKSRDEGIPVDGSRPFNQVVVPAKAAPDQNLSKTKTILERHYYTGLFDEEFPVQLYVQYLKGDCGDKICLFDAMYKFNDDDNYVILSVTRNAEGKWVMVDEKNNVNMELMLGPQGYTGMWLNNNDGTGYDAVLKEKTIQPDRQLRLDGTLQRLKVGVPLED